MCDKIDCDVRQRGTGAYTADSPPVRSSLNPGPGVNVTTATVQTTRDHFEYDGEERRPGNPRDNPYVSGAFRTFEAFLSVEFRPDSGSFLGTS